MKPRFLFSFASLVAMTVVGLPSSIQAQAPGVPIEIMGRPDNTETIVEKASVLLQTGKLLKSDAITAQLKTPESGVIELPQPRTKRLSGREIVKRARQGCVRVGWYYRCSHCENWHTRLSDGYAIAKDTIATCHHCVEPESGMREGYLIAVDPAGEVLPVTAVLAKSATMDAAILRVKGGHFTPLALSDNVAPGDTAFCYSDPLGQSGYVSIGIVNRFYWRPNRTGSAGSFTELKSLRLNVSTEWAPGSSGVAVLDDCGNVIGHVSTIFPMTEGGLSSVTRTPEKKPKATDTPSDKKDEKKTDTEKSGKPKSTPSPRLPVASDRFGGAVLITLHEAVPARGLIALAKASTEDATPAKPSGSGKEFMSFTPSRR